MDGGNKKKLGCVWVPNARLRKEAVSWTLLDKHGYTDARGCFLDAAGGNFYEQLLGFLGTGMISMIFRQRCFVGRCGTLYSSCVGQQADSNDRDIILMKTSGWTLILDH